LYFVASGAATNKTSESFIFTHLLNIVSENKIVQAFKIKVVGTLVGSAVYNYAAM